MKSSALDQNEKSFAESRGSSSLSPYAPPAVQASPFAGILKQWSGRWTVDDMIRVRAASAEHSEAAAPSLLSSLLWRRRR